MDNLDIQEDEFTAAQWTLAGFGVIALLGVTFMVVKLSLFSFAVFMVGAAGTAAMSFQHWKEHVSGAADRANQWVAETLKERSARAEAKEVARESQPVATMAEASRDSREALPPRKVVAERRPREPKALIDAETGDRLYWTGRPSIFRMRPFFSMMTLCFAAAGAGLLFVGVNTHAAGWAIAGLAVLGFSAFEGLRAMLFVRSARYKILEKRASMRTGILSKNTSETRHRDIRAVEVDQSLMQRIFGCGTVRISSAAGPGDEVVFEGIARPQAVAALLRKLQDAN